jgi:hypothetical protein
VPPKERVLYYVFFHREMLPPLRETFDEVDGNIRLPGKFFQGTVIFQARIEFDVLVDTEKDFSSCKLYYGYTNPIYFL